MEAARENARRRKIRSLMPIFATGTTGTGFSSRTRRSAGAFCHLFKPAALTVINKHGYHVVPPFSIRSMRFVAEETTPGPFPARQETGKREMRDIENHATAFRSVFEVCQICREIAT